MPSGDFGEIAVQSEYLFSGYLNSPALTATRLLSNWNNEGNPVFLTGDIGSLDEDGLLWIKGRKDDLVKIRGYRVFLGEVETHLLALAEVANAAVTTAKHSSGDVRIVAFVERKPYCTATSASLRRGCAERMPHFMVPSRIVIVDQVPLLPNGKPDRAALSHLVLRDPPLESPTVLRDQIELAVHEIWCKVLDQTSISVYEHFLDAGGDSFAATQLEASLSKRFGPILNYMDVSRLPTIAQQAAHIAAQTTTPSAVPAQQQSISPILMNDADTPVLCLPSSSGSNDIWRLVAHLLPSLRMYGFTLPMRSDDEVEHKSIGELAAALVPQVQIVQPTGPVILIGSCIMGRLALEMGLQLALQGRTIRAIYLVDAPAHFTFERPRTSVNGAVRWGRQAMVSLIKESTHEGILFAPRAVLAAAKLVVRRLSVPVRTRLTQRQQRIKHQLEDMARAHQVRSTTLPVVLIKGAWSQVAIHYEGQGPDMGWASNLHNLRIVIIPSSHASMYSAPFVGALARAIKSGVNDGPIPVLS